MMCKESNNEYCRSKSKRVLEIIAAGFSILAGLVALGAGLYFIIMNDNYGTNVSIGFTGYSDLKKKAHKHQYSVCCPLFFRFCLS